MEMNSTIGHIYLYVSDLGKSHDFYKKLLEYLGYKEKMKENWGFAFINNGLSIWFEKARKGHIEKGYHRKRIGLNHLAFKVESKEGVDKFFREFLKPEGITTLYETPKAFTEYGHDYYAVFFEDPDRIKLEVAYHT
jgi:catechol 2,3-dioxygenase-like lactoylglutathione lyase family enzyme